MDRYLGCDPHTESCTISVRGDSGKIIRRDVVQTRAEALLAYVKGMEGRLHFGVEEGEWSQWLVEILAPYVVELCVIQPDERKGVKSDARDADGLSLLLFKGELDRAVFKDRGQFRALRDLARVHRMLSQDVTRTKNRIKAFFRGRGIPCKGTKVYGAEHREELAFQLSTSARMGVEWLGRELAHLEELKNEAERALVRESHRHPISRILETAPGLGPVRVARLLPIVVTPNRFRTKRQFWSYAGFGIVTRSSADWVLHNGSWVKAQVTQTRGLNRQYNRHLKEIFKGAATTVIIQSRDNPLRAHYERLLENGTKPNLAKLTIARKIAAIVLAMWKNGETYRPRTVIKSRA
ncbi:MAG: transposase [Thioalkalivibrio sp.]|nr:transposase [Thioalkalivibrio sp.]